MASVTPVPDRDVAEAAAPVAGPAGRAFADLHTHSRASFDSLASPASMVRTAAARGLTHLAITDHDRIDGALEARERSRPRSRPVTVIVGEEIKTLDGDLSPLPERGRPAGPAGGRGDRRGPRPGRPVGIPHPFDRFRGSLLRDERMEDAGRPGRLGRGAQRAGRGRQGQPAGRRARREPRPARDRRVRRPQRVRGRRRLHGPRRRPVHRRRAARGPRRRRAGARPRVVLRAAADADREDRPAARGNGRIRPPATARSGAP